MSTDNGGGLENQNVRQALKNTGLAEAVKGLKVEGGTNRTINFKSTGEWLAQQEAHVSSTPTKDVARIDYTLNYLVELNTKAGQINGEALTQNIDAHTANIRNRIDSSTNLIADLTEIPQGTPVIDGKPRIEQTDLAASICKARVLSEIKGITSVPRKDGTYPTPEEAIAQLHSKTKEARGRIVESRIRMAVKMVDDPTQYVDGEVDEKYFDKVLKVSQDAEAQLAQLQLLQHATHYELTQPGNAGKAAREKAFITAWKENVEQPKKPGRAVKIEALYEDAVKRSPTNEKPLKKNLDENKIQYRGYEAPMPEGKSKPSLKAEIPAPIPNPEPISGLIIQEDLRKLDRETIDKEHVHWHPRALFITDTHGLGYKGLEKRIHAELGPKVKVEFKNGLAYVDGQELPIYHGGDALDLNKSDLKHFEVSRKFGFKSRAEYDKALADSKDPSHSNALAIQERYKTVPHLLDKSFADIESAYEDYNIEEAQEIYDASLKKGRAILGNHEAMMLAGMAGSDTHLLNWMCNTNLGETTFYALTGTSFKDILKEFNMSELTEVAVETLKEPLRSQLSSRLRDLLDKSPKAIATKNSIQKNVKLYNIVNGVPQIHSSIALDKAGKLIPFESIVNKANYTEKNHLEFFEKIGNLTGLEALDYLETQIHEGNRAAIDFVAYSNESLYGRTEFHENMAQNGEVVMEQIYKQTVKKGVPKKPQYFIIGHTPKVGGTRFGKNLLCADDDKGTAVRIDLTYDKSKELVSSISATHNFGQIAPIVNKI